MSSKVLLSVLFFLIAFYSSASDLVVQGRATACTNDEFRYNIATDETITAVYWGVQGGVITEYVQQDGTRVTGLNATSVSIPVDRRLTTFGVVDGLTVKVKWTGNNTIGSVGADVEVYRWYWTNYLESASLDVPVEVHSAVPTPLNSLLVNCGSGDPVEVSAIPGTYGAVRFNWSVPYPGWEVKDVNQPFFSTFNTGTRFVTTRSTVYVSYPPNTPAGDYIISVSGTGACGPQTTSADAAFTVRVDYTPVTTPGHAFFVPTEGTTACDALYDLESWPVPNAVWYTATLNSGESINGTVNPNTGNVIYPFRKQGPASGIVASVVAYGRCGDVSPSHTTAPAVLNGRPASGCGPLEPEEYDPNAVAVTDGRAPEQQAKGLAPVSKRSQTPPGLYPNPAAEQVTLPGTGEEAVIAIYDAHGTLRQEVPQHEADRQTTLNVLALPVGLYHVRVVSHGRVISSQQLTVQR